MTEIAGVEHGQEDGAPSPAEGVGDFSDIDLLGTEALADPYQPFGALREQSPVHWHTRFRSWIVTRYDDVAAALKDPRFSSRRISSYQAARGADGQAEQDLDRTLGVLDHWMVFKDPPDHMRLRRLVRHAFSVRAMEEIRPRVVLLANELLDELPVDAGAVDIVGEFAYPLTANVVAELLGVPREDRDQFKAWSAALSSLLFGALDVEDRHEQANDAVAGLTDYIEALVKEYTARPGDNLVTELIQARESGDALTHDEVVATGVLLLFAGHETTTNLIGNAFLALLRNPDQLRLFLDGAVTPDRAVEELLRYDGPTKTIVRVMADDVGLQGIVLRKGDRVFLSPLGANHDPRRFPDPDRLDLTRTDTGHLQFGLGPHYCLGAPLARLETEIAISEVFRRWPSADLADQELSYHPILLGRALRGLHLRLGSDQ